MLPKGTIISNQGEAKQNQGHFPQPNQELSVQFLQEEWTPDNSDYDLLSEKFHRFPYRLFKLWLLLTFPLVFTLEYFIIKTFVSSIKDDYFTPFEFDGLSPFGYHDLGCLLRIVSFGLLLFGSGELLYAMNKRRCKAAQKSFLRFQYSLIGLIVGSKLVVEIVFSDSDSPKYLGFLDLFLHAGTSLLPVIHLIGGSAILRVFRKNHPLAKSEASAMLETTSGDQREFFEQNKAIAFELLKYDQQLSTWQFRVYRWWLKFIIVFETMRVCCQTLSLAGTVVNGRHFDLIPEHIVLSFVFFVSTWSGVETEVAMTTKRVKKAERAILLLKACIFVSIVAFAFYGRDESKEFIDSRADTWRAFILRFIYCCTNPIVMLVGILKARKIIEQREIFANVSSFTNESYLC